MRGAVAVKTVNPWEPLALMLPAVSVARFTPLLWAAKSKRRVQRRPGSAGVLAHRLRGLVQRE
jgi:hypothetical protein